MIVKSDVLERIKVAKKLPTDAQLSHFLGVKPNTISTWKARNSIDIDIVFAKCEDLNMDWLLTGKGAMLREVSADKPPAAPAAAPATMPEQVPAVAALKEIISEQASAIAALNREIGAAKEENKHILQQNADLIAQNSDLRAQNSNLIVELEGLKKENEHRDIMDEHSDNDTKVPWMPPQLDTDMLMAAEPLAQYKRKHKPHSGATLTAP
jgi:hypothetical protein